MYLLLTCPACPDESLYASIETSQGLALSCAGRTTRETVEEMLLLEPLGLG